MTEATVAELERNLRELHTMRVLTEQELSASLARLHGYRSEPSPSDTEMTGAGE
jgi:hypothetical protein